MSEKAAGSLRDEIADLNAYLAGLPPGLRGDPAFEPYRARLEKLRRELRRLQLEAAFDDPSFERLFRGHYDAVAAFYRERRVRAEDLGGLIISVFARVYRGRRSLRGTVEKESVLMSAEQVWKDALWRRATASRQAVAWTAPGSSDREWPEAEDRREVSEVLRQLPGNSRRSVELHYGQGLTADEAASVLQFPVEEAGRHLQAARERSREARRAAGDR